MLHVRMLHLILLQLTCEMLHHLYVLHGVTLDMHIFGNMRSQLLQVSSCQPQHQKEAFYLKKVDTTLMVTIKKNILEVSPDSYIKIPPEANLEGIALELKCPYPNDLMPTVHYSIPVHYTIQLLCHMVVKQVKYAWYGSYSKQSMVVLELKFDAEVWLQVSNILKELYDKADIPVPKKKIQHQQSLKEVLQRYVDTNTCIIGEVPSVEESELQANDVVKGNKPHTLQCVPRKKATLTKTSVATQLCSVCRTTKDLIQQAYDLQ